VSVSDTVTTLHIIAVFCINVKMGILEYIALQLLFDADPSQVY